MSDLPERPTIGPDNTQFGLDQYDGLWSIVDGELRQLVMPDGIYLDPVDFSDLYLPSLKFVDADDYVHVISISTDGVLMIDDVAALDLTRFYTKVEADSVFLKKDDSVKLKAPSGKTFKITVDDNGKLATTELKEGNTI